MTVPGYGGQTVLRLTPAAAGQGGAAWSTNSIAFATGADTFSTYFQFQITNPGGYAPADGIVFVVQTTSNSVGGNGGSIGYGGVTPSVGIEFDTFLNPGWDPNNNHVGIDIDGGANVPGTLTSLVTASPGGVTNCLSPVGVPNCMANGDVWSVWIDYDGTNLSVALADNSTVRPANIITFPINVPCVLAGGTVGGTGCPTTPSTAFVGFTAGTGAGYETQDVLDWTYTVPYNPINPNPPSVPALSPWAMAVLGILMAATAAMVLRKRRHAGIQ
jgi:hypothetical protein